jgi:hypothetical protein
MPACDERERSELNSIKKPQSDRAGMQIAMQIAIICPIWIIDKFAVINGNYRLNMVRKGASYSSGERRVLSTLRIIKLEPV